MNKPNDKQMIILVLPKEAFDVTYLKTIISDFNTANIANEVFEINTLLLGLEKHLLIIKPFEKKNESMEYYRLFLEDSSVMRVLNKSEYKLMSISTANFQHFYKNKDIEGYYEFFIKNYLAIN
jgi:hypothetical protein